MFYQYINFLTFIFQMEDDISPKYNFLTNTFHMEGKGCWNEKVWCRHKNSVPSKTRLLGRVVVWRLHHQISLQMMVSLNCFHYRESPFLQFSFQISNRMPLTTPNCVEIFVFFLLTSFENMLQIPVKARGMKGVVALVALAFELSIFAICHILIILIFMKRFIKTTNVKRID